VPTQDKRKASSKNTDSEKKRKGGKLAKNVKKAKESAVSGMGQISSYFGKK
jgi:hypothetical protein